MGSSGNVALAISPEQTDWTPEQGVLLKAAGIHPATMAEAKVFLAYCQRTGLDPVSRQIYLIDGKPSASIDGMRLVAQRSGGYEGQTEPEWCGPDGQWTDVWVQPGPPHAARVGVYRAGFRSPVYGVVMWSEFGSSARTWKRMPAHMLAKVAESHALRKAFPADLSGLYSTDEMQTVTQPASPLPTIPPPIHQEEQPPPAGPVVEEAVVVDDDGVVIPVEETEESDPS